ncbi:transcriptional repressor [Candidatus Saccharibacteria bacterium]|nr:transcriptional repressor [Candidatus Saccharibacteria bacterium]
MYDDLAALLKKNNASLTQPRKKIFDLLLNQEPQTMQVLVRRAAGEVDRASVYRTIELFERLGIAHRLNIGWKYKIELSDVFLEHHHHMYCTNCGKTMDLPSNPMLETMIDSLTNKEGFSPRGHSLEVYGWCANCRNT